MTPPSPVTIVESVDWLAAIRPDGTFLSMTDAIEALHKHGVVFDTAELLPETLVDEGKGRFVISDTESVGVPGWVLYT